MDLTAFYELQRKQQEIRDAQVAVEQEAKRLNNQQDTNRVKQIEIEKASIAETLLVVEQKIKDELERAVRDDVAQHQIAEQDRAKANNRYKALEQEAKLGKAISEQVEVITKILREQPATEYKTETIAQSTPTSGPLVLNPVETLIIGASAAITILLKTGKNAEEKWKDDLAKQEVQIKEKFEIRIDDTNKAHEKMQQHLDKKYEGEELNRQKENLAITMDEVKNRMQDEWNKGKTEDQGRLNEEKKAFDEIMIESKSIQNERARQEFIQRQRAELEKNREYSLNK